MLSKNSCIIALIAAFVVAGFGNVDGVTKRVKFARGKSSVTLSNSVIRGDLDTYILRAKAGQWISVRITAVEDNAVFQVESPDGSYVEGAGETDDATSVTAVLPDTGDYRIVVGGTRGNASYRLTVSIR